MHRAWSVLGIDLNDERSFTTMSVAAHTGRGGRKEVSFCVMVHDRTLEHNRLEGRSGAGSTGWVRRLVELFQPQLQFDAKVTENGKHMPGRMAFDATKIHPRAGIDWDTKTHLAQFHNDVPAESAFNNGVDPSKLEDLFNELCSPLHRCANGTDVDFVPTKADLLRVRNFIAEEQPRLDADETRANDKVASLLQVFMRRQRVTARVRFEDETEFNIGQKKELYKYQDIAKGAGYTASEAVRLRRKIEELYPGEEYVAGQQVMVYDAAAAAKAAAAAAPDPADSMPVLVAKRMIAVQGVETVTRIFAFKRQISCNMMAAGFKRTDNGNTFWVAHDWHGRTAGPRSNLDDFIRPVLVALVMRGVPLQILTSDGEHRHYRNGWLHATSHKQLADSVTADWTALMGQVKAISAQLHPNKGNTTWTGKQTGTQAQQREARGLLAAIHVGLLNDGGTFSQSIGAKLGFVYSGGHDDPARWPLLHSRRPDGSPEVLGTLHTTKDRSVLEADSGPEQLIGGSAPSLEQPVLTKRRIQRAGILAPEATCSSLDCLQRISRGTAACSR